MHNQDSLKNYYLSIINELANVSNINTADVAQSEWCEVDFPSDLERMRKIVQSWKESGQNIDQKKMVG